MITKCACEYCRGHIEFEAEHSGTVVACPHCGKETSLTVPKRQPKPEQSFKDYILEMPPGRAIAYTLLTCWLICGLIGLCVGIKNDFNSDQPSPFLTIFYLGLGAILIGLCAFIYFFPAYVAYQNDKRNKEAILVLNILTGWTFIGWVIAIVWAYTKD